MPPKIDGYNSSHVHRHEPVERKPARSHPSAQPNASGVSSRRSEMFLFGSQQRNRLERFLVPGLSGASAFRDVRDIRLAESTARADGAYADAYLREKNALANPASSANPPKNMVEVSRRAEDAYTAALKKDGFAPLDVRGASVVKAAEFLRSQSGVAGDFTTLSPDAIRLRMGANQETKYFVRILDQNHLAAPDAKFSRKESPHTWVATPEEIAGAKLDTFETMKRVGYSDDYIGWIKGEAAANRKNLSDFVLAVTEANGTTGKTAPAWDILIERAKQHADFQVYKDSKPESFWKEVENLDLKGELAKLKSVDKDVYLKSLTPDRRDVFNARKQMDSILGVNEYFTNDGRTARTDGQNETYGVREFLVDNTKIQDTRRTTFVELSETGKTGLRTVEDAPAIPENVRNHRTETRNAALIGGAFSAVTSLPEIFEQAGDGDYTGAARTLATNTAVGTGVGAFSDAGERLVGNQIGSALERSNAAQQGIDRLFSSGAARNVVGRLAGTETSNLTAQTFNSTVRTLAGRVGGAGVIGGVVNGAFSAYDQIGAYKRGEVTGSQAIGTVTGEAAVGVGAGLAGAAAGAAIGSIIPGAGTIVGGVIGFGVGMIAGYVADKGLRGLGVDKMIAGGVTATIDAGAKLAGEVQNFGKEAASAVGATVDSVKHSAENLANNVGGAVSGGLKSMFGW